MLCALTVRQLKPGTYDAFREAWQPDPWPPFLSRAYLTRHSDDPDLVASFGFIELSEDELDTVRDDPQFLAAETQRIERIAQYELSVLVNGVFEVADEVLPPSA